MMDYVEKIQEKVDVAHGYRLGTAFATRNKKYMYDTGTGKVFECEEAEYKILKELFDNGRITDSIKEYALPDYKKPMKIFGVWWNMSTFYRCVRT